MRIFLAIVILSLSSHDHALRICAIRKSGPAETGHAAGPHSWVTRHLRASIAVALCILSGANLRRLLRPLVLGTPF